MSFAEADIPLRRMRAVSRAAAPSPLARVVADVAAKAPGELWHSDWGWNQYEALTLAFARAFGLRSLLEVGGGRDPAFITLAFENGLDLTVNDIAPDELARLPEGPAKAVFDIAGDLSGRGELHGAFDLIASRMVFEHVEDVEQAWSNTWQLLKPGGVAIAFFPTLYAWPFVLNKLIPDRLAKRIVETVFPHRRADGDYPVFPAHYDWCIGSERRLCSMLLPKGFSDIHIQPFWGHHYLAPVPVLRDWETALNRLAARRDWRFFTTYAYVIVQK